MDVITSRRYGFRGISRNFSLGFLFSFLAEVCVVVVVEGTVSQASTWHFLLWWFLLLAGQEFNMGVVQTTKDVYSKCIFVNWGHDSGWVWETRKTTMSWTWARPPLETSPIRSCSHSNREPIMTLWVSWDQCQFRSCVQLSLKCGISLFPLHGYLSKWL